ncbi:MAG: RES family NAD+ phosphorylase [Methylophilaceae bacterium]
MFNTWTLLAVSAESTPWQGSAWCMVEAQHVASTMKIVDSADEQNLLESLLESNKPARMAGTEPLDYLLATPFRYPARHGGSRFRSVTDPGVFYGAESVHSASAELGYWRWKFLKDAPDLQKLEPVLHTAFKVKIKTSVVNLTLAPFDADQAVWTHKSDYSATQNFAKIVRSANIGGIIYQSVRDPDPAWCIALMTPKAFTEPKPDAKTQTWWLAVYQDAVIWRRDNASVTFMADDW